MFSTLVVIQESIKKAGEISYYPTTLGTLWSTVQSHKQILIRVVNTER